MSNIMKYSDLNFVFMNTFVKKIIQFEWIRNFVQNWFCINTKMMRNFMQKSHLMLRKRIDCFMETLV